MARLSEEQRDMLLNQAMLHLRGAINRDREADTARQAVQQAQTNLETTIRYRDDSLLIFKQFGFSVQEVADVYNSKFTAGHPISDEVIEKMRLILNNSES